MTTRRYEPASLPRFHHFPQSRKLPCRLGLRPVFAVVFALAILALFPQASPAHPLDASKLERDLLDFAIELGNRYIHEYEHFGATSDLDKANNYYQFALNLSPPNPKEAEGRYRLGVFFLYGYQHSGTWKSIEYARKLFERAAELGDIRAKIELKRLPAEKGFARVDRLTPDAEYCGLIRGRAQGDKSAAHWPLVAEEYGRILLASVCGSAGLDSKDGRDSIREGIGYLREAAKNGRTFARYLLFRAMDEKLTQPLSRDIRVDLAQGNPVTDSDKGILKAHIQKGILKELRYEFRTCEPPLPTDPFLDRPDGPDRRKYGLMQSVLSWRDGDPYAAYGLHELGKAYYELSRTCRELAKKKKANRHNRVTAPFLRKYAEIYERKSVMSLLIAGHRWTYRFVPFCLPGKEAPSCVTALDHHDPIAESARILEKLFSDGNNDAVPDDSDEAGFWNKRAEGGRSERANAPGRLRSTGTGFYVAPKYVLTNRHVVENCNVIRTGVSRVPDPSSNVRKGGKGTDLALIRVREKRDGAARDFEFAMVGDRVYVFGYDRLLDLFPIIQPRMSDGIVGGWSYRNEKHERAMDHGNYLLYTASTYPGNSGGPLINEAGRVVGVVTGGGTENETTGLAIPANEMLFFLWSVARDWKNEELEKLSQKKIGGAYESMRARLQSDYKLKGEMFSAQVISDLAREFVVPITCWEQEKKKK